MVGVRLKAQVEGFLLGVWLGSPLAVSEVGALGSWPGLW